MGCASSRANGTLEGERETSIKIRRSEVKFLPPRPGQLYVRVRRWNFARCRTSARHSKPALQSLMFALDWELWLFYSFHASKGFPLRVIRRIVCGEYDKAVTGAGHSDPGILLNILPANAA